MEDDIPQALAAMCMNEILDPNWYVNTGATAPLIWQVIQVTVFYYFFLWER